MQGREVEHVQGAAEREHHVVRHVDDVRDGAHAREAEPGLQPDRRLADGHVAEQPSYVARAAFFVLDPHIDRLVAAARGLRSVERHELAVEEGRHLARDPVDGEQVGAIARRLDVEHLLAERQYVGERRARRERLVEHHDPVVIGAEVDFVFGQDHPLRHFAAQLAALERQSVRQGRTRERDRDLGACAEVPGSAHDLVRLALADVDLREL